MPLWQLFFYVLGIFRTACLLMGFFRILGALACVMALNTYRMQSRHQPHPLQQPHPLRLQTRSLGLALGTSVVDFLTPLPIIVCYSVSAAAAGHFSPLLVLLLARLCDYTKRITRKLSFCQCVPICDFGPVNRFKGVCLVVRRPSVIDFTLTLERGLY